VDVPETSFVKTDDGVYLAYQVAGEGSVDIAMAFNTNEGNVDLMWDEPDWRPYLISSAELARLIVFDRRGTGVSSRNVPMPNLETQVTDLLTVLDSVRSQRPILAGGSDGGAMLAVFAATHPERARGLIWNNPIAKWAWSPDYPWGQGREEYERDLRYAELWGTEEYARYIADWRAAERAGVPLRGFQPPDHDPAELRAYARINRNTASPDAALEVMRIDWETDIRAILPAVHAPAALLTGTSDPVDEVEYIASLMPNAKVHIVEGRSGSNVQAFLDALRDMAGVARPAPEVETVLSTVLFTDIVDSTARQVRVGDHAWKELVLAHHAVVRDSLGRWRGRENDTAGDGFYATFDGPARAIRCAQEVVERVRPLGIHIRAGVHTGECEVIDDKCGGLTVSIGARVASNADASEVLVTQTVKDLVAGSGLTFEDAGEHELKGVPDRWHLYRVVSSPA
jgi:class 3 adenylate cyclase/pimeloyl-ACP methyl ester carboxylesterase